MGTPYMGEIKLISWNFPPKGWALCNGQLMQINQNQALFALLGTQFGGNGQTTFGLPDLRGRAALHEGDGFIIGQNGGEVAHTLTQSEMPAHVHLLMASGQDGNAQAPAGNVLARNINNVYAASGAMTTLRPTTISNFGGSQAHDNMQPYLCINFIIALIGVFPSRN